MKFIAFFASIFLFFWKPFKIYEKSFVSNEKQTKNRKKNIHGKQKKWNENIEPNNLAMRTQISLSQDSRTYPLGSTTQKKTEKLSNLEKNIFVIF